MINSNPDFSVKILSFFSSCFGRSPLWATINLTCLKESSSFFSSFQSLIYAHCSFSAFYLCFFTSFPRLASAVRTLPSMVHSVLLNISNTGAYRDKHSPVMAHLFVINQLSSPVSLLSSFQVILPFDA